MFTNAATLSMPSGAYIEISVPVFPKEGQGAFPKKKDETVLIHGRPYPHKLGFVSEDPLVGTIDIVDDGTLKVKYTHLQSRENRIYFFTANNEVHIISIISIPIHTHESIEQGGPAYGTYMADINKNLPKETP
jgi:hypothetical protein